jgi:enamine deaminase RidA (YjgF/YER057c/UK114 family)
MSKRINISSGSDWENEVGYSRAVVVGNILEISGTTAIDALGRIQCIGDAQGQATFILNKVKDTLQQAGFAATDVVRTRMYVTDIGDWMAIGRAHAAFFKEIKPAATMVEVQKLIHDDLLVEIEVTAIKST